MKIEIELDNLTTEEQEKVKRLAEKKKPYFVPEYKEIYYYLGINGSVFFSTNCEDDVDGWNLSTGNCFHTRAEAEKTIKRMQMQTKWKHLSLEAGEANNPWDGEHGHYYVWYSDFCNEIETNYTYGVRYGIVTFPSDGSLKAAIAELGEENVKKYILGVEK